MKRKFFILLSCVVIIMILMAVSSCRDFFHSKENIDYMDLVLNKEYDNSVAEGGRNYYKFNAELNKTYYISWYTMSNEIKVATFWYDTGGTVTGEKEGLGSGKLSFSTSRSGDVVVRITSGDYAYGTIDYKLMVSTSEYNVAGGRW